MHAKLMPQMSPDLLVVNAARNSFGKESWYAAADYIPARHSRHYEAWCDYRDQCQVTGEPFLTLEDYGLIRYLAEHNHWTPFGHPHVSLQMSAPVPIRTQCFKHKVGFVENEESRRYISNRPVLYVPDVFRKAPEGSVKQGSGGAHSNTVEWRRIYETRCHEMIDLYEAMIADGVAPEQARFALPQGVEVRWTWTGSLMAYARFAVQRTDPHAQQEVEFLARQVHTLLKVLAPVSWSALVTIKQPQRELLI